MKKEALIIVVLSILVVVMAFANPFYEDMRDGSDSSSKGEGGNNSACINNSDCAPRVETYCGENNSLCQYITYYQCINESNSSRCVPFVCKNFCNETCEFGCDDGECLEPALNLSDLIVYNITNWTVGDDLFVSFSVKNIGVAPAPASVARAYFVYTEEFLLFNVPSLSPNQIIPPFRFSYSQPRGTLIHVNITADYEDLIEELNEENNEQVFVNRR